MTTPGSNQPPGPTGPAGPPVPPGTPAPVIGRASAVGRVPVSPPVPPDPVPYPGAVPTPPGMPPAVGAQPFGAPHPAAPVPAPTFAAQHLTAPTAVAPPVTAAHASVQPGPAQPAVPQVEPSTAATRPDTAAVASATAAATAVAAGTARPLLATAPGQRLAVSEGLRQDPPAPGPDAPPPPAGPDSPQRLPRLRIGSHTASPAALARLRVSTPGTGMIIGADQDRRPVPVRFFRPGPTRITLVGGLWASQLIAFRALALGARVAIVTAEPRNWDGFGERVTGRNDRVALVSADQPLALTATARQPVLVIQDAGLTGSAAPQPLGPWQAQLTVLRQLDRSGVPVLHASDLVLLQRLANGEAALATDALRLSGVSAQYLQAMTDDMLAVVMEGAERYLWLAQTEVERQYGGAPRR